MDLQAESVQKEQQSYLNERAHGVNGRAVELLSELLHGSVTPLPDALHNRLHLRNDEAGTNEFRCQTLADGMFSGCSYCPFK